MNRSDFMSRFDFPSYVYSKFDTIVETSDEDRVRVLCPFCGDSSGHLYILLSAGLPYCQRCKYSPKSPIRFISDLESIPIGKVIEWVDEDGWGADSRKSVSEIVDELFYCDEEDIFEYVNIGLEESFVSVLEMTGISIVDSRVGEALQYLYSREVTDDDIIKFDIRFAYAGKYSGRIIVPCRYEGDVVSFVARDISGNSDRKYLNPLGNKQSDFLFNRDSVESECVVVVEGVFDAIKISSVCPVVASFGKSLSARQMMLLNEFREVIFYWDMDAYPQAELYADKLSPACRTVLHPDTKDAGDRTPNESLELIGAAVPFSGVDYEVFKMNLLLDKCV